MPRTLAEWLAHCERLHPVAIEMALDRVRAVRERLGLSFQTPVISVAGTNGKGSTCAFLEAIALQAGYRVGLYSKPHLVHFEERCRIGGRSVDADALVPHFEAVEAARGDITLTYFEFTTLAIARLLAEAPLDLVILEVGLGGRLDAVNVFDADCSVLTPIAIDHADWLGPDRESIGREKAGILRAGRPAVLADASPPDSVLAAADQLGCDLWRAGRDYGYAGDRQQWNWWGRHQRRYAALAPPALRGASQMQNASTAIAALESLRDSLPLTAQAVRLGLATVQLAGRFQVLPGQPAVVLDVAHNPQAAAGLALNLDQMGYFPRTLAVFGAMQDKDLPGLVAPLLPLIDAWHVCDLPIARAAPAAHLVDVIKAAGCKVPVHEHAGPRVALSTALGAVDPVDRILVFGSFHTVGGVLQAGTDVLAASRGR